MSDVLPLDRMKEHLAQHPLGSDLPVKKPRAKPGTAVYKNRDSDKRRAYFRDYQRKRRAAAKRLKALLTEPSVLE